MLNEHAKMHVQRMMYCDVNLRSFATKILVNDHKSVTWEPSTRTLLNTSSSNTQLINAASFNSTHIQTNQ